MKAETNAFLESNIQLIISISSYLKGDYPIKGVFWLELRYIEIQHQ